MRRGVKAPPTSEGQILSETRTIHDPFIGKTVEIRNDLTKRLRGIYASGPTLANGEPEFGWRKMAEPPPIQVEAAEEIDRLRSALNKVAVVRHVRMAEGGGTVPSGYSCEICEVECGGKLAELRHMSNCPLFPLNSQP